MKRARCFLVRTLLTLIAVAAIPAGLWLIYTSPDAIPHRGVKLGPGNSGETVYISVASGDTAVSIGKRLEASQVIDSANTFERLADLLGVETTLEAGEYEFTPGTSALDALTRIRDGLTAARVVTIPEGIRMEEIAAILEQRGVVQADAFLAAAASFATSGSGLDAELLASRPPRSNLEGYMYPATYSFSTRNGDASRVVQTMLETFSQRLTPQLRQEARRQDLTMHEVLTLAAIVQREAVLPAEMPVIASVFLNRINEGMPLEADPTVQYAVSTRPGSVAEFGYWKRALTVQDLRIDSTYNTYLRQGLPPGPIANPGIEAITAVIRPAHTDFLFFVARQDGSHAFSETFEEHQINVQRYQR
jgi:peptidoglycan lytic transglycosylase G